MYIWVLQLVCVALGLWVQGYVRRRAANSLPTEQRVQLHVRTAPYRRLRLHLILLPLLLLLVIAEWLMPDERVLAAAGVAVFLAIGSQVMVWLYDRLSVLTWPPGMLEAWLFAEMLLFVVMGTAISIPLLHRQFPFSL